jgi:protein-S-isoprenylcysteine O-methyltransferase Ste14
MTFFGNSSTKELDYHHFHTADFFIALKAAKKAPLVVSSLLKTAEMLQFEMFVYTIIPFEENRLQKNFGSEYERYRGSVRRWL